MIVECPNCQAKFRLPDEKIGPQGATLRCGKCRHVFTVEPPAPPAPPEASGLTDFDFPEDMAPPPEAPPAPRAPAAAEVEPTDRDKSLDDPFQDDHATPQGEGAAHDDAPPKPGFSLDDVADIPLPGSRPSTDRRRHLLVLAGAVVFVVVVVGVAIFFLDRLPGKKPDSAPSAPPAATAPAKPDDKAATKPENAKPDAAKPAETDTSAKPDAASAKPAQKPEDTAKVKDITLQNIRQYYVSNEKAGQLFVIEGEAVNKFKTPKEMIKLEATLFDDKGASLASQDILSGNRVSLFQLQVMTRKELEDALSSQVGVLTNNTNLPTDGVTPFMVVFFDPPESVKEYGIKVVDAKDPPRP